jgi:hypothetical protein
LTIILFRAFSLAGRASSMRSARRAVRLSEKQYQTLAGLARDCRFFLNRRPRPSIERFRRYSGTPRDLINRIPSVAFLSRSVASAKDSARSSWTHPEGLAKGFVAKAGRGRLHAGLTVS